MSPVVAQYYDTDVNKEYAIRGNSAVLKCVVPSFVADFVTVLSWHTDQGEEFLRKSPGDEDYGRTHHLIFKKKLAMTLRRMILFSSVCFVLCTYKYFCFGIPAKTTWMKKMRDSAEKSSARVIHLGIFC